MTVLRQSGLYLGTAILLASLASPAAYAVDNVENVKCTPAVNGQKGDLPCKYKCPSGKTCSMKLTVRTNGQPPVTETSITMQGDQEYTVTENAANSGLLAHSCTHPA